MSSDEHWKGCPQSADPSATCLCDELEERAIRAASVPSPAELIRRAKSKGLITPKQDYGSA